MRTCCLFSRRRPGYEVGGVMHYFQGDEGTARKTIDMGFLISLARPLLRLEELQKTVAVLPSAKSCARN